jgi:rRNA processing protein Gar1
MENVEDILDNLQFSEEEDNIVKNDKNQQNDLTEKTFNTEMKKISEYYEEDESMNKYTGTKNEKEEIREIPVAEIPTENDLLIEAGEIQERVEGDKILCRVNLANGILDLDNVLYNVNKIPFGYVDDVIGRVDNPYYVIKLFPSNDSHINHENRGDRIFFLKRVGHTISTKSLMGKRGCDASNAFDEELPENEVELSDDEEEKEKKKRKKSTGENPFVLPSFPNKTHKKQRVGKEEEYIINSANKMKQQYNNPQIFYQQQGQNQYFTSEYKMPNQYSYQMPQMPQMTQTTQIPQIQQSIFNSQLYNPMMLQYNQNQPQISPQFFPGMINLVNPFVFPNNSNSNINNSNNN